MQPQDLDYRLDLHTTQTAYKLSRAKLGKHDMLHFHKRFLTAIYQPLVAYKTH